MQGQTALIEQIRQGVLAEILCQIPAGIVVAEAPSGRIILYNPEAERIWRRTWQPGEEIWKYRQGCMFRADGQVYGPGELPLARALRDGEIVSGEEVWILRGDGTRAAITVSSAPLRDANGQIVAAIVAYIDISDRACAEEELRRAQERLQGLINSVDGIVWEVDVATFRFTFVSEQAVAILGYPLEDWYEPNFWAGILHPEDRNWAVEFCMDRTRRCESHDFEYRVLTRDGRIVWLRDIVSVIMADGHAVSLRGIMVDITSRKQAEQDRERLLRSEQTARTAAELEHQRSRFLADVSRQLAGSLDYEKTLAMISQLAVPFLADWAASVVLEPDGRLRSVLIATEPVKAELARELEQCFAPNLEAPVGIPLVLRTGESVLYEYVTEAMLQSDEERWPIVGIRDPHQLGLIHQLGMTSYIAVPLRMRGRLFGAMVFVSARKERRYGASDLSMAEDMAQRVSLALDNALLYNDAQAAIRLRDEFLSIAAHELYTPLSSLQLVVQQLTGGTTTVSPETRIRLFQILKRQTNRLTRLISTLLDASRIHTGGIVFRREVVDLAALVRDLTEQFAEELAQAHCPLSLELPHRPVLGHWDHLRLEQVVANLLSNAIKFGAGKSIAIRVDEEAGRARLEVEDHGIGIAPSQLSHIFGQFERAVPVREYGGLGLGLYIARSIVEGFGGTIRVVSTVGQGSTFTVELPCPSVGSG
jgi:PAS domain S-box-containing protein